MGVGGGGGGGGGGAELKEAIDTKLGRVTHDRSACIRRLSKEGECGVAWGARGQAM